MTIETRYILDSLTSRGVSILAQQVLILDDGTEQPLAQTTRRGYANSAIERQQLEETVPEPYRSAVLAVWGDAPTVAEEIPETAPAEPAAE